MLVHQSVRQKVQHLPLANSMKMPLFFTRSAVIKLGGKSLSDTVCQAESVKEFNSKKRLRIEVSGGGCSGYKYKYLMDETATDEDLVFKYSNVEVIVDKISFEFINGATLDYLIDLGYETFNIKNPIAKISCGCGNSFAI